MSNAVFISYSHHDQDLKDELVRHLAPLKLARLVDVWHDGLILPGAHLDETIAAQLASSDLILLLLSASFLASGYCTEREMLKAYERAQAGYARVVGIIVRPCQWKIVPIPGGTLGNFLALPNDGKAITTFSDRDTAWDQVANSLTGLLSNPLKSSISENRRKEGIYFNTTVYFQENNTVLSSSFDSDNIRRAIKAAMEANCSVVIVGQCVDTEGGIELAERRAKMVAKIMVDMGIAEDRIRISFKTIKYDVDQKHRNLSRFVEIKCINLR